MTKEIKEAAVFPVPRAGRTISPLERKIQPHPEEGDLPPCEAGIGGGRMCPRPATTHYGYAYYCDGHVEDVRATERYDHASDDVHHAKLLLWRARERGVFRLEHRIGQAVEELAEIQEEAEREMLVARERADRVEDVRPGSPRRGDVS